MKTFIPISLLITTLLPGLFMLSCSTMSKKQYEQQAKTYIQQFEKNLSASDQVILAQFRTDKTDKVILKAIQVMQNQDLATDSIQCILNFKQPTIAFEDAAVQVRLMAHFQSIDLQKNPLEGQAEVILWLSYDEDENLYISKIEADQFYTTYRSLVNELRNIKNKEKEMAGYMAYIDKAKLFKDRYDSVIWYTTYGDSTYYYVVNGSWTNYFLRNKLAKSKSYTMGLVSETGREVIPPAYDMVGTIGFEIPDVVEVKKDGLVGHFNLNGIELVSAQYDLIIPINHDSIYALTRRDTTYGWIAATDYSFHDSPLPPKMDTYIREFGYLDKQITIDMNTTITEILDIKNMGFGIVMPSTHYVKANVLPEIVPSIHIGFNSMGWGQTAFIKTKGSFFTTVASKISAFLLKLQTSYVEGREGFYDEIKLTFVDADANPIGSYDLLSGNTSFNRIDSTLLEVKTQLSADGYVEGYYEPYGMNESGIELNLPRYTYFKLNGSTVTKLDSKRQYSFTEFVKLDSSYLSGEFAYWDSATNKTAIRNFLCEATLIEIRNELLASYGYIFETFEVQKQFERRKWYQPRYNSYLKFIDQMTDIDKHNLLFLESIVGTLETAPIV